MASLYDYRRRLPHVCSYFTRQDKSLLYHFKSRGVIQHAQWNRCKAKLPFERLKCIRNLRHIQHALLTKLECEDDMCGTRRLLQHRRLIQHLTDDHHTVTNADQIFDMLDDTSRTRLQFKHPAAFTYETNDDKERLTSIDSFVQLAHAIEIETSTNPLNNDIYSLLGRKFEASIRK